MISYMDKTFCPFWVGCVGSGGCGKALTPEVVKAATAWWGGPSAPLSQYSEKPDCYEETNNGTQ